MIRSAWNCLGQFPGSQKNSSGPGRGLESGTLAADDENVYKTSNHRGENDEISLLLVKSH